MAYTTRFGSWCDVIQVPAGWALVYVDDADVVCEVNGVELWRFTTSGSTGTPIYIRAACDPSGVVKAACTMEMAGNVDHAFLIEDGAQTDLLTTVTQRAVLITYEEGDFVVYACDSYTTYVRYPMAGAPSAPIASPFPSGSPLGFLDIVDGTITWATGDGGNGYNIITLGGVLFFLPNSRTGITVGQAKGEPMTREAILAFSPSTGVSTVIAAKGFDPHLARITSGIDAGKVAICARIIGSAGQNCAVFLGTNFPAYDGTLLVATIPPVSHAVEEETGRGTRMTQPWQGWAQAVRKSIAGLSGLMSGVQQALVEAVGFGIVAVTGQPSVQSDAPNDILTLSSDDASVVITTKPLLKTVDLSVVAGAPADAEFIVAAADPTLTAERVAINNGYTTWDFTTPAQAAVNLAGPLPLLLADPGTPEDNRVWFFATSATLPSTISLRVRLDGVTHEIPMGTIS